MSKQAINGMTVFPVAQLTEALDIARQIARVETIKD